MKLSRKKLRKLIEQMIKPELGPYGDKLDIMYKSDSSIDSLDNTKSADSLHASLSKHEEGYAERMGNYITVFFDKPEVRDLVKDYMASYAYTLKEELAWWAENETDSFEEMIDNLFNFEDFVRLIEGIYDPAELKSDGISTPQKDMDMLTQLKNIMDQFKTEPYVGIKASISNKFKQMFREVVIYNWVDWRAYTNKDMNLTDPAEIQIARDYVSKHHPKYNYVK